MDDIVIGQASGFCAATANIWQIVGYVLLVFKIVVPILLIVFGMIDLGKAVIGSKEDDTKKAINGLVRRLVAAVVIFFIPTIIGFVFRILGTWKTDAKADYDVCKSCITSPSDSACDSNATTAWKS